MIKLKYNYQRSICFLEYLQKLNLSKNILISSYSFHLPAIEMLQHFTKVQFLKLFKEKDHCNCILRVKSEFWMLKLKV